MTESMFNPKARIQIFGLWNHVKFSLQTSVSEAGIQMNATGFQMDMSQNDVGFHMCSHQT